MWSTVWSMSRHAGLKNRAAADVPKAWTEHVLPMLKAMFRLEMA